MEIKRPSWKIFLKSGLPNPSTHDLFLLFNEWIASNTEVLIDVADYSHLQGAPRVYLNGFSVEYAWDEADNRPGFLCRYRQPLTGTHTEKLQQTLREFLAHSKKMQEWFLAKGQEFSWDTTILLFKEVDRAEMSTRDEGVSWIGTALKQAFPGCALESWGSDRDVPGVYVKHLSM